MDTVTSRLNEEPRVYRFVVLLDDTEDSEGLARLLEDVLLEEAKGRAEFVAPRVPVAAYLAGHPPGAGTPTAGEEGEVEVLLLGDSPELSAELARRGSAAELYLVGVGVENDSRLDLYGTIPNARPFRVQGPLDFAAEVMARFSALDGAGQPLFDADEARRMRSLTQDFPPNFVGSSPTHEEATPADDAFARGWSAYARGDYEDALKEFDNALGFGFEDVAAIHEWRAACLAALANAEADGQQGEAARRMRESALEEAMAAQSRGADVGDLVADLLFDLGRYPDAARAYESLASGRQDVGSWMSFGTASALSGQLDTALAAYNRVEKLDPEHTKLARSRGAVFAQLGRLSEARSELERALIQNPDDRSVQYRLAEVLLQLGHGSDALRCLRRAEELGFEDKTMLSLQMAAAYSLIGSFSEALANYRAACDAAQQERDQERLGQSYEGIGHCLMQSREQLPQARRALEEAIALGIRGPGPDARLATVFVEMGLPVQARVHAEKAIHQAIWRDRQELLWRLYGIRAAVYLAMAEEDGDDAWFVLALRDVKEAKSQWYNLAEEAVADRRDRSRILLIEGAAELRLRRARRARAAFREARNTAPLGSAELLTAEELMRRAAVDEARLPRRMGRTVTGSAVMLLGLFTWLLYTQKLTSASFAAVVTVLLVLPLAAYLLPSSQRLRLGALEFERDVTLARLSMLPRLDAPMLDASVSPLPSLLRLSPERRRPIPEAPMSDRAA